MNLLGFTAQASLYRTANSYRSSGSERGDLRLGESIVPQLPPRNAPGLFGCLSDCSVEYPNWTRAQCRRYCLGDSPPSPGGQTPGSDSPSCLLALAICQEPALSIPCVFFGECSPFYSCLDSLGCPGVGGKGT
jgi:hypothetical protein